MAGKKITVPWVPKRAIRMTSPFMKGEDIKVIQERLPGLKVDGEWGPASGAAGAAWKERVGYRRINTAMSKYDQLIITGQKRRPPWMVLLAKKRAAQRRKIEQKYRVGRDLRNRVADAAVDAAERGLKEDPAGSNRVPWLQWLAAKLGLAQFYRNMGWPWCVFFGFILALQLNSRTAELGLMKGKFNPLYTVDILARAQNAEFGMKTVGMSQAERGDFVLIDFPGGDPRVDHMAIFLADLGDKIRTAEGNTSSFGSQDNGGAVLIKERDKSLVRAIVRYDIFDE